MKDLTSAGFTPGLTRYWKDAVGNRLILERKRASCAVPGCSGSRGLSVGSARTGRQAIFIYGSVRLGISCLLAFFSDHLLKKRLLRFKRRFARRAPIANPG